MSNLFHVSSSPHVRSKVATKNLMYDVAIAMLPATAWGVIQFGVYSLFVVVATVLACVLSEYVFESLMGKPITISDGSAAFAQGWTSKYSPGSTPDKGEHITFRG